MVKHIFITIRFKDIGNLTINDIADILINNLNKYIKIIGVCEKHVNGRIHYHIIIIIKEGLSKHTYRNSIRELFPILGGHGIDIEGIRNISKVGKYILKHIENPNEVFIINITLQDFILKYIKSPETYIYYSILSFVGSLDD